MTPIYMPFTYLPSSTAHILATLFGPVVVYQPLGAGASDSLASLAAQGLIEIRTPLTGDEQRLKSALVEFTQWAPSEPGTIHARPRIHRFPAGQGPFFRRKYDQPHSVGSQAIRNPTRRHP